MNALRTWFLPPGCPEIPGERREETRRAWGYEVTLEHFHPSADGLRTLARHLRGRSESLRRTPVRHIVAVFEALAERWLDRRDPVRVATIDAIAAATGFSRAMVAHAIDLEQKSSRGAHLLRALTQELGSPEVLDDFAVNPLLGGHTRAIGPRLVGAVFSANIPGLPHLEVMRAFLVKAACLGKVAHGEPVFLAAYARTLAEHAPELAACLAVVSVERDDGEARRALLGSVDHVIAYGGPDAIATLRADTPATTPATWHGHRLGFAVVLQEALHDGASPLIQTVLGDPRVRRYAGALEARLPGAVRARLAPLVELPRSPEAVADALAYDFSVFDQQACLAPAALYVEGRGARGFARTLAAAMARWAERLPPAQVSVEQSAARRAWLDERRIDGAEVVAAPAGLPYAVVLDDNPALAPHPGGRAVRVIPVVSAGEVVEAVRPLARHLQCAAIEGRPERRRALATSLAELGVTRVTRAGLMGLPTMMWRHDGTPCLGSLVRFCDDEQTAPERIGPLE